ncbi:hypothetical protein ACWEGV_19635, partial [Streptomyces sp. NPDC004976]
LVYLAELLRPEIVDRFAMVGAGLLGPDGEHYLTDGQIDELTHRLLGPLTRLLRTELRMDRERIGRLRDPRS